MAADTTFVGYPGGVPRATQQPSDRYLVGDPASGWGAEAGPGGWSGGVSEVMGVWREGSVPVTSSFLFFPISALWFL